MLTKVDHAAIKTSQFTLIVLNILAFLFNLPLLVIFTALVLIAGVISQRPGFGFLYQAVLKPRGWTTPEILLDNPEPHRFAQILASVFLTISSLALYLGAPALGWGLVWLVAGLAALNVYAGFCVGCAVYYWLNRLHLPGFDKTPPVGSFPGMRPKGNTAHES